MADSIPLSRDDIILFIYIKPDCALSELDLLLPFFCHFLLLRLPSYNGQPVALLLCNTITWNNLCCVSDNSFSYFTYIANKKIRKKNREMVNLLI